MSNILPQLIKIIILFTVYLTTAKLGLNFDAVGGFATLIWPPAGISLGAMLIFGIQLWPAVALGAFVANFSNGAPLMVAAGISVGNTLEAVVAVYLLRFFNFKNSLDELKDVLKLFIIGAVFSTLISATIGTSSLLLGKVIPVANYFSTWFAWWIGDMLSNIVIAPLILVWSIRSRFNSRRILEATLLVSLLALIGLLVFGDILWIDTKGFPITYLMFPPLIWIALRFDQRDAVSSVFLMSILAIFFTIKGFGPFASTDLSQGLLFLQGFIGVSAVTSMILAAIATEKKSLEKRKDEFISVASHELKTPLTTIKGYVQILEQELKKYPTKNLSQYISKLGEQTDRLTQLINDLLDVSKIQSGKLELKRTSFNLKELIDETVDDIINVSRKHKIIVDGGEINVLADRNRIYEVLINLLSNAIKFSPKSNKIIISLSEKGEVAEVSIQDFGIGLSKGNLEKIFEKFYQANTNIRQSFSGLGLGLYICYEIIKNHGGKIWVKSIRGKGTTFSFTLPIN